LFVSWRSVGCPDERGKLLYLLHINYKSPGADTFPEQQYSIRLRTPEARIDGMGFFPCGGGRRAASGRGAAGGGGAGKVMMGLEVLGRKNKIKISLR